MFIQHLQPASLPSRCRIVTSHAQLGIAERLVDGLAIAFGLAWLAPRRLGLILLCAGTALALGLTRLSRGNIGLLIVLGVVTLCVVLSHAGCLLIDLHSAWNGKLRAAIFG